MQSVPPRGSGLVRSSKTIVKKDYVTTRYREVVLTAFKSRGSHEVIPTKDKVNSNLDAFGSAGCQVIRDNLVGGGNDFMRSLLVSFVLVLLSVILVAAQPRKSFSVGTASAQPGQKVTGTIEVPPGVDAGLSIPVAVVNGAKPGPVLALVAGSHGTEYTSIIALEKLIGMLNPAETSGTVIIVPLINIQSFEQKVPHVNPE